MRTFVVACFASVGLAGVVGVGAAVGTPGPSPLLTIELPAVGPNDGPNCYLVDHTPGIGSGNIGSVTRALAESAAREHGLLHAKLKQIYESNFVSTAKGGDGSLSLVFTLLDASDLKNVLAQVDVEITPTHASGRPDVKASPRDQVTQPSVGACESTTLAGSKDKRSSNSSK